MKGILLILFLVTGLFSTAQVRPDEFPIENNPTNENTEFYSQKNGVSTRVPLDALASALDANIVNVASTPSMVGNTENLGEFVSTPTSEYFYIAQDGRAIQLGGGDFVYGTYKNDADAAGNGVPINGTYEIAGNNTMGKSAGDTRKRKY